MKRAEKIALLTKVLQEGTSDTNRQRLQQMIASNPRPLIVINDSNAPGQPLSDNDPVHFIDQGTTHRMTLGEVNEYARRFYVETLFILPAKQTINRATGSST